MKLVKQGAELLLQPEGLEGIYKQIELAGRTCYKSEDKITEDSAKPFVDRMIKSQHTAMLEHGTVYLKVPINIDVAGNYLDDIAIWTKCHLVQEDNPKDNWWAITTNYRVLVERDWLDDLQYICSPTEHHEKRYTMKFITDRGVSHELVRHRVFSFAQESTRYCNYSKDKFVNEVTFIKPSWADSIEIGNYYIKHNYKEGTYSTNFGYVGYPQDYLTSLCEAENVYFELLNKGWTPQQARQILPNALKTEVCMTGYAIDWRHFFDLRLFGKTGNPHPNMKQLAELMQAEAKKSGIWEDIMRYESKFD